MILVAVLLALLDLCVLVAACVFLAVCICACVPRSAGSADCLIVLGARIHPDGTLSHTLQYRCENAFAARQQGLGRRIIVCGGQGADEPMPEARAMQDFLLQLGVPAEDILMEPSSGNTLENLKNAMLIMEHRGFRKAALVTSDYHLTRSLWIAHALGMHVHGIPAPSPRRLVSFFKMRIRETGSWFLYFIHGINGKNRK